MNIEEARAKLQTVKTPEISSREGFSSRNTNDFLHVEYSDIYAEAHELMDRFNLRKYGWRFKVSNTKRIMGECDYTNKTIMVSRHYLGAPPSEITDTILHEIAHALAAIRHQDFGHGPMWRQVCTQVGARPQACCDNDEVISSAPYRYRLFAPCCDKQWFYYRRPSKHPSRYCCPTHGNQLTIEALS